MVWFLDYKNITAGKSNENGIQSNKCEHSTVCADILPKAFTLIELLVVISIIALLLSILLPSMGAAKEHAKKIVCLSNLRSFGLAMHTYSMDQNGKWPSFVVPSKPPEQQYWTMSSIYNDDKWMGLGLLYRKYIPAKKIYFCPNEKHERSEEKRKFQLSWNNLSQSEHLHSCYHIRGRRTLSSDLTNRLANVSKRALVSCWFLYGPAWSVWPWYPSDTEIEGHHRIGRKFSFPVLFGDGHAIAAQEHLLVGTASAEFILETPALQNYIWSDFEGIPK